uniref:Putative methyltransferase n=1 Tax=viral metagenome TaxID=1070528 RepID=A0A6H1Z7H5_9ZZZZ
MKIVKIAARAMTLASALLGLPVFKLQLGGQTLHQRLSRSWLAILVRRLAIRTVSNPMVVHGHTVYWHPRDYWMGPQLAAGRYEQETVSLWVSLLSSGMTAVDLGAHVGLYSLLGARQVGQGGRVYAFEPEPSCYALLLKNIAANGYRDIIIPVNSAVSNTAGKVELFLGELESGETSLYPAPGAGQQRVTVEAVTLDEFFEGEGWPPVQVMKMDIEGAEKVALEGMRQLVARNPSLKLIMEFGPGVQASAGVSPEDLFGTLTGLGFQRFWALRDGVQPVTIPEDIPQLVKMAERHAYVNLLCGL